MKIATYNVNSVNARLENLSAWLNATQPDIVLLQEIKSEFNAFPFFDIQMLGYDAKILGQKSYNGVAILSKHKIKIIHEGLPNFVDENARYLEADVDVGGRNVRVASIYMPNGNPPYNAPDDTTKFEYKLRWMDAFLAHAQSLLEENKTVVLGGDFNVIFTDADVYNPELFRKNALMRPETRERFRALLYQGWFDAFRTLHPQDVGYTFWDYSGNALTADYGMRIDYLMLSPKAADMLNFCQVDKSPRTGVKPSDHTALVAELKLENHEEKY